MKLNYAMFDDDDYWYRDFGTIDTELTSFKDLTMSDIVDVVHKVINIKSPYGYTDSDGEYHEIKIDKIEIDTDHIYCDDTSIRYQMEYNYTILWLNKESE